MHFQLRLWAHYRIHSTLYCRTRYHGELAAFIPFGVPVALRPIEFKPEGSVDCWIGRDGFHTDHNWHEYDTFYVEHFADLSAKIGVASPVKTRADMLFDSPAIPEQVITPDRFDWLIINAEGQSGQWDHSPDLFMRVIQSILNSRRSVVTTHPCGIYRVPSTINWRYNVAQIAKLSTQVENILAVDTGPTGATFNVWNEKTVKNRLILHKENWFTHPNTVAIHSPGQIWGALKAAL